ncbi:inositol monophosphatase [Candidatus Parcubacteria bacterium]|jgi:histidinol-phosphatase|nr:inositol monophosphatase [Candidatus Parcubacteria bacterium]
MRKSKFLQAAIRAAKKSEKVILKYYSNNSIKFNTKKDNSPVTIADVKAEKIIIDEIKKNFPNHSFLGEESGQSKNNSEYQWIIDPIDGTTNFTRGIPFFSTEIALMKNGKFILGVSNAPALQEMLYAEKGKGAYKDSQKISVSNIKNIKEAYSSTGSLKYFVRNKQDKNLSHLNNDIRRHRIFGDFWNYHLLACGKVDIVIEANTKIWDIAALLVIVEESGGKVTDITGKSIDINSTDIIATNGKLHSKVLSYFK